MWHMFPRWNLIIEEQVVLSPKYSDDKYKQEKPQLFIIDNG
jgi:hypothetical protein